MSSLATPSRPEAPAAAHEPPPAWLRSAVRGVLLDTPSYQELHPDRRRELAQAMVRVGQLAADCIAEEHAAQAQIDARKTVARALEDQPGFGESARRIGQVTRDTLEAISFPRFVTDLLNGVFRAMNDSSQQQLNQFLQLLNAVSGTAEGFAQTQTNEVQVRAWLVDHFPASFEMDLPDPPDPGEPPPDPEDVEPPRLRLKAGGSMPSDDALRAALGVQPGEDFSPGSNPEALVPLARRQLARQRQSMLATMVQMGMQRIVIDAGRITAAMRFHIDTRSAASQDRGSQFGMQNRVRASGSFGAGPWGVSAEVENTISYVSTERSQSTEEMNTSADLNSSVELNFHTDAIPLNRLAAQAQADRVRNASLNPDHEAEIAAGRATTDRIAGARSAEEARRGGLDAALRPAPAPTSAPTPAPAPRPTPAPTPTPTPTPTPAPTHAPTHAPTPAPSGSPAPARSPAASPAPAPSAAPATPPPH
jgi:hypothetical protein